MAATAIGLRRLVSQRIAAGPLEQPADVVRWLGAVQAQDYSQSLWAIGLAARGARRPRGVERAIAERQIVRTWLMRGTIHFTAAGGRALAAGAVRPAPRTSPRSGAASRSGSTAADLERCADAARRRARGRPAAEPSRGDAAARAGGHRDDGRSAGTTSSSGSPSDGLICLGPMQGRQQTFVLLDDWAPRAHGARAHARRGARAAGGALRREPRAGDRPGPRALGGHHARATPARACRARRGSRRAHARTAPSTGSRPSGPSGRRRAPGAGGRICSRASTSTCSATRIATPCSSPSTPARSPRAPTASSGR